MPVQKSSLIDFVLLIPCFNNKDGLIASLNSISYPKEKFEVLIVDDGSTIPLNDQELKGKLRDMNIHVLRLDQNQGIVKALNTGLAALKLRSDIKYIARLDAGDINHEQRFYKQVDFLNRYKEIALLASWARFQNKTSTKGYDYITKTTHENIKREMHLKCSFIHPSVMFRKEVIDIIGIYPENFPHAEDYAFFWKIMKVYKTAVIPEKLLWISYSDSNISVENYKKQLRSRKKVVKELGNNWFKKIIGLAMLNLKLVLPKGMVQWLKSCILPI